ncbi:MAG: hypothetical protein ACLFNK_04310 [Candidatus Woesearchaeota archaeon]
MEMDRYLEKRSILGADSMSTPSPKKKRKKKSSERSKKDSVKSGNPLSGIVGALRSALDVDEVIDLDEVDEQKMSVFELTTFKDRLSRLLKPRNIQDGVHVSEEEPVGEGSEKNDSTDEAPASYMDKSAEDMRRRALDGAADSSSGPNGDYVPQEKVREILKKTDHDVPESVQTDDVDDADEKDQWEEFRNDLRDVITITYKIMKKVPPETIKNFKKSDDFKKYVGILDKYDLIRKHSDSSRKEGE